MQLIAQSAQLYFLGPCCIQACSTLRLRVVVDASVRKEAYPCCGSCMHLCTHFIM